MLIKPTTPNVGAKIIVCGIGGAGNNAINSMIESGLIKGVHFIAVNTDSQALEQVSTDAETMVIGSELTKGLGAGGNPAVGKQAVHDSVDYINEALVGADMVFVTAGMGGGTGTGATPEIAGIAKQLGALTIGVVTKPFDFEMSKRMEIAEKGIAELTSKVDALIVIPNQKILEIVEKDTTFYEAMKKSDEVLLNAVKSISDIITITGHINVDFADVKTIMQDAGTALMGVGESASKENRARESALKAINSPLLDYSITGAKGVLISIRGSNNLSISEVGEAVDVIRESVDPDANLKYGVIIDDTLGDEFVITVLATGFDVDLTQPRTGMQREAYKNQPSQPSADEEKGGNPIGRPNVSTREDGEKVNLYQKRDIEQNSALSKDASNEKIEKTEKIVEKNPEFSDKFVEQYNNKQEIQNNQPSLGSQGVSNTSMSSQQDEQGHNQFNDGDFGYGKQNTRPDDEDDKYLDTPAFIRRRKGL